MTNNNFSFILQQIEEMSQSLNGSGSPIDWYKTLQKYEHLVSEKIRNGVFPEAFSSPLGVQFELTYNCNLRCIHCYNYSGNRSSDGSKKSGLSELTDEEWLSVVDDVADMNVFECIISGGEPLLKKGLVFNLMEKLARCNVYFILISNGWLVDEATISNLTKFKFHYIQISIDGATPDVHDAIRGRSGSWKRAIQAAGFVKEAGLPLCIAFTIMNRNFHQLSEIIDMAVYLGADRIIADRFMSTGAAAENSQNLELPSEWRKEYFELIQRKRNEHQHRILILSSVDPSIQLRQNIIGPTKVALIRPNGDIKLDCISPFVFGNVKRNKLSDVWQRNMSDGWRKKEVIDFVRNITSDHALMSNGNFPVPHLQNEINLEHYLGV